MEIKVAIIGDEMFSSIIVESKNENFIIPVGIEKRKHFKKYYFDNLNDIKSINIGDSLNISGNLISDGKDLENKEFLYSLEHCRIN